MQVEVTNLLDICPDGYMNASIEIETIQYANVEGKQGVRVIASCSHIDVCKIRRDDE